MLKNEILQLQKEIIYPSLTILMPTTRITTDGEKDKILLKNLIKELEEKLKHKVSKKEADELLQKVNEITQELDFKHMSDGLGIFVNPKRSFYLKFPFPVPTLTVVDDTFETKYLIKQLNRTIEYLTLNINEKETILFKGYGENLETVNDEDFPFSIEEVVDLSEEPNRYAYESAQLEKYRRFVREVDRYFKKYQNESLPVIIAGINKLTSLFEQITDYKNIAGKIEGSFDKNDVHKLGKESAVIISKYLEKKREEIFNEFIENFGKQKSATGILDIWNLSNQGRVEILLVEENYHQPTKFEGDQPVLVSDTNDPFLIEDLVDEIIEIVFKQKGKIYFYEEGKLKDYQRMGAILRY